MIQGHMHLTDWSFFFYIWKIIRSHDNGRSTKFHNNHDEVSKARRAAAEKETFHCHCEDNSSCERANLTIHLRGLYRNPFLRGESVPLASQVDWGMREKLSCWPGRKHSSVPLACSKHTILCRNATKTAHFIFSDKGHEKTHETAPLAHYYPLHPISVIWFGIFLPLKKSFEKIEFQCHNLNLHDRIHFPIAWKGKTIISVHMV